MFIYYEHLTAGIHNFTDIVLSSDGRTNKINWSNPAEKSQQVIIGELLKGIPASERDFVNATKIWTYLGAAGPKVISILNQAIQGKLLQSTTLLAVKDLKGLQAKGNFQWVPYVPPVNSWNSDYETREAEKKFDEKDFFYAPPPSTFTGIPTGDALYQRLADLMETPVVNFKTGDPSTQKKLYRAACIRLHPDRGGDATKMSELTMLWTAFNAS